MGVYSRVILPRLLDAACGMKEAAEARARVVPLAVGRVLEVGIGSGLNLPFYDPGRVTEVVGTDPEAPMTRRAAPRAAGRPFPVTIASAPGERLPFDDASFDTAVVTFTFCTIPDPARALAEVRRVLRPGGELLFYEHTAAPDESVRRWQGRLTPAWRRLFGGCHLDRDFPATLTDTGFDAEYLRAGYEGSPRWACYLVGGRARPRG